MKYKKVYCKCRKLKDKYCEWNRMKVKYYDLVYNFKHISRPGTFNIHEDIKIYFQEFNVNFD